MATLSLPLICLSLLFTSELATGLAFNRTLRHPVRRSLGFDPNQAFTKTVISVGDLHSRYDNAVAVLQMAEVIDANLKWTGKADVLVQTGDIFDKGDHPFEIVELFEDLRKQAKDNEQEVVSLVGNHEVQNLYGDWRDVTDADIESAGGIAQRQALFRSGPVSDALRNEYKLTARVSAIGPVNADYNPEQDEELGELSHAALSFVHGGFIPPYIKQPYPSRYNNLAQSAIRKLIDDPTYEPRIKRTANDPPTVLPTSLTDEEKALIRGDDSALWFRGWARDSEENICPWAEDMLKAFGVRRFVMGHEIQRHGITARCDGQVILIDTDISSGNLAAAKFEFIWTPLGKPFGSKDFKYKLTERVTALYPSGPVELVPEKSYVVKFPRPEPESDDEA